MKTLIIKSPFIPWLCDYWRWNWYVIIPKWHPLHWVHYNDIDVDVHWWLTYSEEITERNLQCFPDLTQDDVWCWLVWFDTLHRWDNEDNRPKEAVQKETDRLRDQILLLYPNK